MMFRILVLAAILTSVCFSVVGCSSGGEVDANTVEKEDKAREEHNKKAGLSSDNM